MERNIIIVSMVRSDKIAGSKEQEPDTEIYGELGYAKQESLGFADIPNRLNVALSRAKRLLIIVGNSKHFCKHKVYNDVYETIKLSEFDKIIDCKTLNKYNSITLQ
jgi:superfamily I DNA and/or RNA helicase